MTTITALDLLTAIPEYKRMPDAARDPLVKVLSYALGMIALACTARLIYGGGRLAWLRNQGETASIGEVIPGVVGYIIAASSTTAAAVLLNIF